MKNNSIIVKRKKIETINDSITPYYINNNITQHCLIELLSREVKRTDYNTIHLSGRYIVRNDLDTTSIVSYTNVQYGKNVNFSKKANQRMDQVNINKIKGGYIATKGRKNECVNIFNGTLFVSSSHHNNHLDKLCTNDCESGIMLLLFERYDNK